MPGNPHFQCRELAAGLIRMTCSGFSMPTRDGLNLRGRCWTPPAETRAAVCLVHGLGEHIGRYDHVAHAFNRTGIALLGTDLRGHGNSEGKRGHVPTFGTWLDDLFQSLEKTRAEFPNVPLFLYGHSLGGMVVLDYVLERKPELAGVIASAPLLKLAFEPPRGQQLVLKLLNALHLQPAVPSGLVDTNLSRDLNVVRAYRNDPLTHGKITPALAGGMLAAGQWCLEHAGELNTPCLLLHGAADRITSPEATRHFASKVSSDCKLEIWPGLFHEPHNEPEKDSVHQCITRWILERAGN